MVLGYHLVFGMYGFWLPNDPRVGIEVCRCAALRPFGPATGLDDRSRSVAGWEYDWRLRLAAKGSLKYPAVRFSDIQAKAAADGFGDYVTRNGSSSGRAAFWPITSIWSSADMIMTSKQLPSS